MHIAILHPAVPPDATLEDQDTLVQVDTVTAALESLGHRATAVPCTLDLAALRQTLLDQPPQLVFNLVESVAGADSLQYVPPALLDAVSIPYTGCSTEAIFQTTHKLVAKQLLRLAGLPTPNWLAQDSPRPPVVLGRLGDDHEYMVPEGVRVVGIRTAPTLPADQCALPSSNLPPLEPPCIVKAVWEHASRGLDDQNVVGQGDAALVRERLRHYAACTGRPCFAEQFIAGREFNLALLDGPAGPEALPPAEIDFSAFPPDKPRIVGHRAKWETESFEFSNTPRTFDFPAADGPLLDELRRLALGAWQLFGLRGYARVDFRVDAAGRPWILEINTNPCLSPDAGFAAAVARAGISFPAAIQRILDASL